MDEETRDDMVEDTDADTKDEMETVEESEQETVEDTDADTKDVMSAISELGRKIDAMNAAIAKIIASEPKTEPPADLDQDGSVSIDELEFD